MIKSDPEKEIASQSSFDKVKINYRMYNSKSLSLFASSSPYKSVSSCFLFDVV